MKKYIVFLLIFVLCICFSGNVLAAEDVPEAASEEVSSPAEVVGIYDAERNELLGRIYGILIFFVVVILLYFSYKFLRIFF